MNITGTFLDEITHDIPSQNWSADDWARDFDAMKRIGIDTVILIRAGYRNRLTFNSQAIKSKVGALPVHLDLVDLFLRQAERCGMKFFFGTYDSGVHWNGGAYQKEIDLNKAFCDEVITKYGHSPAFQGWYISHEINTYNDGMMKVYEDLSRHLRQLKNIPILISPYVKGVKQFGQEAITLAQHAREWDQAFARMKGHVDIVAFQDGQIGYDELPDYLRTNRELADKYGITSWSNIESFDRDMPIKFPPADFGNLRYKMDQATQAGVDKLITFEFSHFMSPNSCYPSAHNLYRRYLEWMGTQK